MLHTAIVVLTTQGLAFKEILWDAGWIWVLMLIMAVAWIFDTLRQIMRDAKGKRAEREDGEPRSLKPSYEVIVRRRIE
jgi:hypothetical protein